MCYLSIMPVVDFIFFLRNILYVIRHYRRLYVRSIKNQEETKLANKGKYYMTTAIAYTSGKPHIGNTYEIILADAIARYKRAE